VFISGSTGPTHIEGKSRSVSSVEEKGDWLPAL
jgi:hypothetical protein